MSVERIRHKLSETSGTSAVEFAIVAPAFLILLLGVFATGWAIHRVASVRYALEESGRTLLVTPAMTAGQFDTLVKSKLAAIADSNVTTSLTVDAAVNGIKLAHASAAYNFTISIPMIPDQSIAYQTSITVPLSQ